MSVASKSTFIPGPSRPVRASGAPSLLVGGGPSDRYRRVHRPVHDRRRRRPVSHAAPNPQHRTVAAVVALAVFCLSVLGGLVAGLGGEPASAAEAAPSSAGAIEQVVESGIAHHVARPGDTLWSIASAHHGAVDHGDYLEALIRLNGGTRIEAGQAVRLP